MFKSVIYLFIICVLLFGIGFCCLFYMLLKKAVKNGVLEALEEYHSEEDCEE